MNYIIKTIKCLEDSNLLIDGITETVEHEIKKEEGGIISALLAPSAASLVQPAMSSVLKGISGRGNRRVGRGIWIQIFSFNPFFKQYQDY